MSALGGADLQNSAGENLASQSDQPPGPSVLRPFCEELRVDAELKLSCENFNRSIGSFYNDRSITPLSQVTQKPAFPTPHVLALFASKAYRDYKEGETDDQYERRLDLPDGWKLLTTVCNSNKANGYFGAAYWHPEHQQVVIAHQGTKFDNFGALWTDVAGVMFENHVAQMGSASTFANNVVEVLQSFNEIKGVSFQLFFTGHSLGGWLAQVTTFTTKYLKREGNLFLRSYNDNDCCHPHTVVFDSPGCKDMLSQMRDTFDVRLDGRSIDLEHLDITSYLSAPNLINTCNSHLGTVYRIFTDLSDMGWWEKNTALYTLATHSMDKIVQAFDRETGQVYKDEQGQLKVQVVIDWPISAGLKGGKEYRKFFEWAKHLNNYHPNIKDSSFLLLQCSPIRYQTKLYDQHVNSFSIFSEEEQEFLQCYRWLRQWPEFFKPKELFSVVEDNQAKENAEKVLQSFEIERDTLSCTDANALQALIPYVKRLLQLFPEIKENTKRALLSDVVRNRVYQFETRRCVEQISQSPLEFNFDSLSFREFLESEQQKVLHLQMVKGDEWTGLIKVYQVLQMTGCISEGQYTVLKLERLLTVNQMMDLSKLMQSTVTPYLLLIACEDNQQLDEETKDIMRILFDTIKQKQDIKMIFITRSESSTVASLHRMGRRIFGNGFVSRVEQVTWSDLTNSSQEKLLEESVYFQGNRISLKKIMSAESPLANLLPLGDLLEGKELQIADPVPVSDAYNEGYYIRRTFRHQKVITQKIASDKDVKRKHVFLASAEEEFKQLCQLYPNKSVHWLEKDNSGKIVWQQSQGTLETVRRYIDTDISHRYTADDLDKLLEQAQHQRLMLISDTAGMGKSTVLTYLSKQIKQKFPNKWVVRIDLNDHTDALKALKQEQIDKEKVIAFVSEKLLKLKPGLEMELLKQCCEQKQNARIVIMLDGCDEISPLYKETVIGLLQTLRQTTVEQLWVTTRPHLREELEDKLQQLSYTLEPFSEEDQVEFLKKFWCLQDWFTEPKDKEEETEKSKLEIYAEKLIKKLSKSISDKDRELTGIPLLTRMLAEAFDEEIKTFYQSAESVPELPFQLDLLGLYGQFIERKYDIFQEEKLQVRVSNVAGIGQREHHLKSIREDHQLLALKVLFTEEQVAFFQNNRECSFSVEDLTRIGIVQVSHDSKLHFIHRTFAEYYVADCLVNRLTEGNKTSEQVKDFILTDIFLRDDYRVIRVFVDGLLSRTKPPNKVLKQYGNGIHDVEKSAELILHRAVWESNANIVGFLVDCVQAAEHTDTVNKLLLAQDEGKKTAWHIAALMGNIQILENLQKCAEVKLTKEEVKNKFLLAKGKMGRTAWHVAAENGKVDVLQKIWEWAKENLTREEIKNNLLLATDMFGRTAWQKAAQSGNLDLLLKIWEGANENLTREEKKHNLLLATDARGKTAWHVLAAEGKLEVIQKLWEWAKMRLTREEIKHIFLSVKDNSRKSAWQTAAEGGNLEFLLKMWEWAEENVTTEQKYNNLFLSTDLTGRTVLHMAAEGGKLDVLRKIRVWAEENLPRWQIKIKLLLGADGMGRTIWHVIAKEGNPDALQIIWEWAKENLTKKEVENSFLLNKDKYGRTAWHEAAENGKIGILQKIWDWAKENLTTEEIENRMIFGTDNSGRTFWQQTPVDGKLFLLQKIWEWDKGKLTREEVRNNFFLNKDNYGRTAWHEAVAKGKLDVLQKIWEWAKENLTREEIKNNLLLDTDNRGNSVWYMAAQKGILEALQEVWDWANETLTTEEIKNKFLLATDDLGWTPLHVVVSHNNLEAFDVIWNWAVEKLTTEEICNKFLLATDGEGRNIWHLSLEEWRPRLMQKLWNCAKDNLTKEEINNKVLLATDSNGTTLWHLAVGYTDTFLVKNLCFWAEYAGTTAERCSKLFLNKDRFGRTVWQKATDQDMKILETLGLRWIRK